MRPRQVGSGLLIRSNVPPTIVHFGTGVLRGRRPDTNPSSSTGRAVLSEPLSGEWADVQGGWPALHQVGDDLGRRRGGRQRDVAVPEGEIGIGDPGGSAKHRHGVGQRGPVPHPPLHFAVIKAGEEPLGGRNEKIGTPGSSAPPRARRAPRCPRRAGRLPSAS